MTTSYFPPVAGRPTATSSPKSVALDPLLPTPASSISPPRKYAPSQQDFQIPIKAVSNTPPQECLCAISDPCILDTLALLLGSMYLLSLAVEESACQYTAIPKTLTASQAMEHVLEELLPPRPAGHNPERNASTVASLLLRRVTPSTVGDRELCAHVRQRLTALSIHPIDTFAPMQHHLHIILTLLSFEGRDFRTKLNKLRDPPSSAPTTINDDTMDLMMYAYEQLTESSLKAHPSQFDTKLEALLASIRELEQQTSTRMQSHELDIASSDLGSGEIVDCVAVPLRSARLIPIAYSVPPTTRRYSWYDELSVQP